MGDRLGIFFSGMCFCHCIITPILVIFAGAGAITGILSAEWVHKLLIVPVFLFAAVRLPKAWLVSRNNVLLVMSLSGVSAMAAALFFHGPLEVGLTAIGSVCLITAHVISLKTEKHTRLDVSEKF